jgi:hypothetical protein
MSVNAESAYYYNNSLKTQGVVMASVGGVLLVILLFTPLPSSAGAVLSAPGLLVTLGIANILLYGNKAALLFYENHLELKAAPLAPLHIIKYDDIKEVKFEGKKILIHRRSTGKPVKLYQGIFNKDEVEHVKSRLQQYSNR